MGEEWEQEESVREGKEVEGEVEVEVEAREGKRRQGKMQKWGRGGGGGGGGGQARGEKCGDGWRQESWRSIRARGS